MTILSFFLFNENVFGKFECTCVIFVNYFIFQRATKSTVDGEIIDDKMYEYKIDYDLGDIVLLDDCIHQGQKRVSEMIYSQDSEGQKMYPSFEDLEDDDDEED